MLRPHSLHQASMVLTPPFYTVQGTSYLLFYTATSDLPSDRMERNERLVGYAMYTFGFSPWKGRELNLEDLFVREEYRSKYHPHQITI